MSESAGILYIVATPIGNMGDISRRAVDVLGEVALVYAEDTRHSGQLFKRIGVQAALRSLHQHNERERLDEVLARLRDGEDLALISDAGTPLISDPGYRLVEACHREGIRVSPVPGASSVIAALSVAGLPTDQFCYVGFPAARREARRRQFRSLAQEPRTVVLLESTHRITACLEDLCEATGPARRVTIARELTKLHESIHQDSLDKVLDWINADTNRRRGEFVVMLEGRPPESPQQTSIDHVLLPLLAELPLRQAASLTARILDCSRREAYQRALQLKDTKDTQG